MKKKEEECVIGKLKRRRDYRIPINFDTIEKNIIIEFFKQKLALVFLLFINFIKIKNIDGTRTMYLWLLVKFILI